MPRNLRSGLLVLALLTLLALAAPLLASDQPWLARGPNGLSSPALERWLGFEPAGASGGTRTVLRAPIPHRPDRQDLRSSLESPSAEHWMGTDVLGRDLAARVVHGTRVSLQVGYLAALFALIVGVPLGALAGYFGRWTDAAVSRLVEALLCFPTLLLALALLSSASDRLRTVSDVLRIAFVLGVTGWIPIARYLRAEVLRLRRSEVVTAARAAGCGHCRTIARHILPSALTPVLVTAAFSVGAAIGIEAALSFLGLGVRPPTPTWGGLLAEAREHVDRAWWLALFPGVALFAAVVGCNLVGEGVRDLLDPRTRRP